MNIYFEIQDGDDLRRWVLDDSWSGAKDRYNSIDDYGEKGWDYLFEYLESGSDMSETELNDFIWFTALDVLIEEYGSSEEVKDKLREISSYLGREVDVNELDDLYETEDDKYREGEDYDSYLQDLIDEYRELESKLGDAKPTKANDNDYGDILEIETKKHDILVRLEKIMGDPIEEKDLNSLYTHAQIDHDREILNLINKYWALEGKSKKKIKDAKPNLKESVIKWFRETYPKEKAYAEGLNESVTFADIKKIGTATGYKQKVDKLLGNPKDSEVRARILVELEKRTKPSKAQDGAGNPWWWIKPPVGVTYIVDYNPYDETKDDEEREIDQEYEWENFKEIIEWFLTTANERFTGNDFSLEYKQADRESVVYEGKLYNLFLTETDYGDAVLSLQRVEEGELKDIVYTYHKENETEEEKEYQELLARQNELFEPIVGSLKQTLLDNYPNDVRIPTSAWTSGELQ